MYKLPHFVAGFHKTLAVLASIFWTASESANAGNTPPLLEFLTPENGACFMDKTVAVIFRTTDEDLNPQRFQILINGAKPTTGYFGSRRVDDSDSIRVWGLSSAFELNKEYVVFFEIYDLAGQTSSGQVLFDTFSPTNVVIEAEDYNFAGGYLDFPAVSPLGESATNAYNLRTGNSGVDFKDLNSAALEENAYRPADPVAIVLTTDYQRARYSHPQLPDANIYDLDVAGLRKGEWRNYTRHFGGGVYQAYLRQWLGLPRALVRLETITGDTTSTNQTAWPSGAFWGSATDAIYRNVPLTDATGERNLLLRLDGLKTWRLVQETEDATGANWLQNYFVFVPVTEPVKLRPALVGAAPLPGEDLDGVYPVIQAVLMEGETGLGTEPLRLEVNNEPVTPRLEQQAGYRIATYVPGYLPEAPTNFQARIVFQDGEGILLTNQWNFGARNARLAVRLEAADTVDGPFSIVPAIQVRTTDQTVEAPSPLKTQFYRVRLAATAPALMKLRPAGLTSEKILLRYEF